MKKTLLLLVAVVFGFVATGLVVASEEKEKNGPEVVVFKTKKKGDVTFKHREHQVREKLPAECADCHHSKGDDGKQVAYKEGQEIGKCVSCHTKDMKNKKLNTAQKALHENCKGCHKEKAPEVTKKKCKACHPKADKDKK